VAQWHRRWNRGNDPAISWITSARTITRVPAATPPAGKAENFFRNLGDTIAKSANPNMKIDMSEWNLSSTDWRTGLYCGGLLNVYERNSDIIACLSRLAHAARFRSRLGQCLHQFRSCRLVPGPIRRGKTLPGAFRPNHVAFDGATGGLNVLARPRMIAAR